MVVFPYLSMASSVPTLYFPNQIQKLQEFFFVNFSLSSGWSGHLTFWYLL